MIITFKLKEPDKLESSLTVTATVSDMRALLKQMESIPDKKWPVYGFIDGLRDVITNAEKVFYSQNTREGD